eukprot:scaffold16094_cov124-Isochrysis_galbana.AAC.1
MPRRGRLASSHRCAHPESFPTLTRPPHPRLDDFARGDSANWHTLHRVKAPMFPSASCIPVTTHPFPLPRSFFPYPCSISHFSFVPCPAPVPARAGSRALASMRHAHSFAIPEAWRGRPRTTPTIWYVRRT